MNQDVMQWNMCKSTPTRKHHFQPKATGFQLTTSWKLIGNIAVCAPPSMSYVITGPYREKTSLRTSASIEDSDTSLIL